MVSLYPLVVNEVIKLVKKKRLLVVLLILAALIPMFVYAQARTAETTRKQFGTEDWRVELRQKITDYSRSLSSARIPEEWKEVRRAQIQQLQYYLDHDVNPNFPGGVTFTREFMKNAAALFIPLMVMVIASDLVSGEHAAGTMKLLLTRPVKRWKILLSKWIALLLFISIIIAAAAVLCYVISGVVFGFSGWSMPVFIGFEAGGGAGGMEQVRAVPQWLFIFMEMGLIWYAAVIVGILSLMISVLIRSTAAGMGVMLAVLISGSILSNMVSSWETAKYLFMVNLDLVFYLTGGIPPIQGMTLPFSLAVLTAWGLGAMVVSFVVFSRKDMLN